MLVRRAQNQLRKAQDRLHLVSGFLSAMGRLDDVVTVSKCTCYDTVLFAFGATAMQAARR